MPRAAVAHFLLETPVSWRTQDALGSPQKLGPCGDEGTAAATGAVTAFAPGETITITLDETIFHPGHYRVALAVQDRSELPAEPPVTAGDTACGSVPVMAPPVFPVLADGMLPHDAPFADAMSFQVTLPSDIRCTRCTLQVLEWMSDHPKPCFYHHCADISIQDGATSTCASDVACDDGDACTRDRCGTNARCTRETITPSDAFTSGVDVAACATDDVPPIVARLFSQAGDLVARATGATSDRLLRRARKRLHAAATKIAKRRRLSDACRVALDDVLGRASSGVECLRSAQ